VGFCTLSAAALSRVGEGRCVAEEDSDSGEWHTESPQYVIIIMMSVLHSVSLDSYDTPTQHSDLRWSRLGWWYLSSSQWSLEQHHICTQWKKATNISGMCLHWVLCFFYGAARMARFTHFGIPNWFV
jgi:hypothetical protein